jgi:hypothetical protein
LTTSAFADEAGTHDPDDVFYGWCELFLKSVASGSDKMDSLARSLIAFYGPHSCKHYAGEYAVQVKMAESFARAVGGVGGHQRR